MEGTPDQARPFHYRDNIECAQKERYHWEDRETLLAEFPDLLVSSRLFEIDRDRYTCSGGVSPLDLMTFVLRRPPGNRELAQ